MTDDDTTEENVSEGGLASRKILQGGSIISVNTDKWSPEKQKAYELAATKESDIGLFEGRIEHAYSLDLVISPNKCPECNGGTDQLYCNFIYATQISSRIMFAPAGYFCEDCPTVIIDEEMIARGVTEGFTYEGVLGLDFGKDEEPNLFDTWNGLEPVYIVDEDMKLVGITIREALAERPSIARKKPRVDKRKKMAKQSRKRNRKK